MANRRKILTRLLSGSKNVRFADFLSLLEAFGFVLKRISGSHHIYTHPKAPLLLSLQPDANGRTKPYQVRQFLKMVEEYSLSLQSNDEDKDSEEDEEGGA